MKIFISWSGPHAMRIATILRSWLKNTFDSAEPWVSDIDISGGQVSLAQIADALDGAKFGIVVTTKANQDAPWLSYEAGAMSRVVDGWETRVMPMLVDLRVSDLTSPLKQYQAARFDAEGVGKLIKSIGEVIGLDAEQIRNKIDTRWPDLERLLAEVEPPAEEAAKPARAEADVLDEILTTVRAIQRSTAVETRLPRRLSDLTWMDMRGRSAAATRIETVSQAKTRDVITNLADRAGVEVYDVLFSRPKPGSPDGEIRVYIASTGADTERASLLAERLHAVLGTDLQLIMTGSRDFAERAAASVRHETEPDLDELVQRKIDAAIDREADREVDRMIDEGIRASEDGPDPEPPEA